MNKQNPHTESLKGKIDWSTAVIPFVLIAFLCISFMAAPDGSRQILDKSLWVASMTRRYCRLVRH